MNKKGIVINDQITNYELRITIEGFEDFEGFDGFEGSLPPLCFGGHAGYGLHDGAQLFILPPKTDPLSRINFHF